MTIAAVVIGRNEGALLITCLEALQGKVADVVYVDSGSDDGSVAAARRLGARVVELDLAQPFTAARARNAGLAELSAHAELVQFLDGDCEIRDGWIAQAQRFLADRPDVAVVCGRRRERHPGASVYNALIDHEWATPVGQTRACGGDAMMRVAPLRAVDGYRDSLIAGEEPELCLRLRQQGWKIWRLDAEMTWHDARITRFSQWWQRSRRAGYAYAEGAALHGAAPEHHWSAEVRRAILWGGLFPLWIVLFAAVLSPWFAAAALIYPAQVARLSRRGGWRWAFFTVLGKFPEVQGVAGYLLARARGKRGALIEYK